MDTVDFLGIALIVVSFLSFGFGWNMGIANYIGKSFKHSEEKK